MHEIFLKNYITKTQLKNVNATVSRDRAGNRRSYDIINNLMDNISLSRRCNTEANLVEHFLNIN